MTAVHSFFARRRRGDGGFTVIEMVVVTMIMGTVSVATLSVLYSLTRNERTQSALVNNQEQVRLTLIDVARDLRAANPLVALSDSSQYATRFEATVPLASGSGQEYVRWWLSGTTLYRSKLSGPLGSTTSTRTALTNVRNASNGVSLFQYFDSAGDELTSDDTPGDFSNCAVRVHISVSSDSDPGPVPFTANSDVQVRNRLPGGVGC